MKNQVFPEAISSQWQKPMFSFYNYVPMKYQATPKEWDVRKFIWNFKEGRQEKEFSSCSVISFDRDFFNGKRVILFDDIVTRGLSYARFAAQLEYFGAEVMCGVFLGKTLLN